MYDDEIIRQEASKNILWRLFRIFARKEVIPEKTDAIMKRCIEKYKQDKRGI